MVHLGAALPKMPYALDTHYPWQSDEVILGGRIKFADGSVMVPEEPGLGVELDKVALARLHQNYINCGLKKRNDEVEMQKKVPGWKFQSTRW
jgi:glucarate dehydratase